MCWSTQEGNPECTKKDFRQRIWVSQERPGLHKPIGVWIAVRFYDTDLLTLMCRTCFFQTVDGCEILHQLIANRLIGVFFQLFVGFQPSFWCCRIIFVAMEAPPGWEAKARQGLWPARTMAVDIGAWDETLLNMQQLHILPFILERRPEGNRCARCVMPGLHGIFH